MNQSGRHAFRWLPHVFGPIFFREPGFLVNMQTLNICLAPARAAVSITKPWSCSHNWSFLHIFAICYKQSPTQSRVTTMHFRRLRWTPASWELIPRPQLRKINATSKKTTPTGRKISGELSTGARENQRCAPCSGIWNCTTLRGNLTQTTMKQTSVWNHATLVANHAQSCSND